MTETLVGRVSERNRLRDAIAKARNGVPQLVVLFGRRRVGKTFLLHNVLDHANAPKSLYIAALRGRPRAEAVRFAAEIERMYGRRPEADWLDIFSTLVQIARDQLVILAIDEAPYLIADDPSWTSALQHAWDDAQDGGPCHLLFCLTGSAVATLSSVISSGGPLFGRPTDRIRLDPFDLPMAQRLLGTESPAVATIEAYAACGGYPLLLREWNPTASAQENLERLAGLPLAPLGSDANVILQDLDKAGYRSVLSAIGRHRSKRSEIQDELGQRVDRSLAVLEDTGLIRRNHPIDDRSPRTLRYQLADPYLAFWFRLIDPNQQAIDVGQGKQVIRRAMKTVWQQHIADVFEDQAREHAIRLVDREDLPPGIVGRWWTDQPKQAEIDVVVLGDRWEVVGEAKWTTRFGTRDWRSFAGNIDVAANRASNVVRRIWTLGPVDQAVTNAAPDLVVYRPDDMVV